MSSALHKIHNTVSCLTMPSATTTLHHPFPNRIKNLTINYTILHHLQPCITLHTTLHHLQHCITLLTILHHLQPCITLLTVLNHLQPCITLHTTLHHLQQCITLHASPSYAILATKPRCNHEHIIRVASGRSTLTLRRLNFGLGNQHIWRSVYRIRYRYRSLFTIKRCSKSSSQDPKSKPPLVRYD